MPEARLKQRLKFFPYELCFIFYLFLNNALIASIFRFQIYHFYLFALAGGLILLTIFLIVTLIFRKAIKTTWFTKWTFTKCPNKFHEIMKFAVLFTQISVIFVFNFVLIEFVVNANHYLDTPIHFMGGTKLVRDLAIVKQMTFLNVLLSLSVATGVLWMFLHYFQIIKPEIKAMKEDKEKDQSKTCPPEDNFINNTVEIEVQ